MRSDPISKPLTYATSSNPCDLLARLATDFLHGREVIPGVVVHVAAAQREMFDAMEYAVVITTWTQDSDPTARVGRRVMVPVDVELISKDRIAFVNALKVALDLGWEELFPSKADDMIRDFEYLEKVLAK